MTLPVLLHHLAVVLSITMAGYALTKWGSPRTLYFTCYTLAIAIYAVGSLLEVTADSLDAAVIAVKMQYFGLPFLAPFYLLFSKDYIGSPVHGRLAVLSLNVIPILSALMVNMWPALNLYYAGLGFQGNGPAHHLVITPGPLYRVNQLYTVVLMVWGTILIVSYYVRAGRKVLRHLAVFLVASAVTVAGQALYITGVTGGWDVMPLAVSVNGAVLGLYMLRFRRAEWYSTGREVVVQNMKDAFVLVDSRGHFLDANTAAGAYFPGLGKLAQGDSLGGVPQFPAALLDDGLRDCDFTLTNSGKTLYMRASRSPLAPGGVKLGTIILIYDNTENHMLMNELQQLATHDTLTGLLNRGTFFSYATRDFDLCLRKRQHGSVLMMDIDHFKQVNDERGHQAGDRVLATIAGLLLHRLRHTDICGRYGGEEFAVWLPDATSEGAGIIADMFRRSVEQTAFASDWGTFYVTISIGVAGLDHTRHESFDQMVSEADEALYRAKNAGRNQVCVHSQHPPASFGGTRLPKEFAKENTARADK